MTVRTIIATVAFTLTASLALAQSPSEQAFKSQVALDGYTVHYLDASGKPLDFTAFSKIAFPARASTCARTRMPRPPMCS
ncbi:MAG TPA: hypothetical protein VFN09_09465 [Rhodanobacteraceae bacterium]|nr:hypothetical protein [Rhodanobacteraceae bacterium]